MEKKLTPMMQLRKKLQEKLKLINDFDSTDVFSKSGLINAIHLINTEMLPIEREMIDNAFAAGAYCPEQFPTYFTKTYKTE